MFCYGEVFQIVLAFCVLPFWATKHWSVTPLAVLATLSTFQLEGCLFSAGMNASLTFLVLSP